MCNLQVIANRNPYLLPRDQLVGIQTIITQPMQLHFLQNLPHHLVTTIHLLNICTVEVVDTSQHLAHFNFSKVLLIVIILSLYGCPVSNLLVIFLGLLLHHDSYKSYQAKLPLTLQKSERRSSRCY